MNYKSNGAVKPKLRYSSTPAKIFNSISKRRRKRAVVPSGLVAPVFDNVPIFAVIGKTDCEVPQQKYSFCCNLR